MFFIQFYDYDKIEKISKLLKIDILLIYLV